MISTLSIAQDGNFTGQNSLNNEVKFEKTDVFLPLVMKLDNPCEDSLYLELKEIPLDEMSYRQFEVFRDKDKACNEYMNEEANKAWFTIPQYHNKNHFKQGGGAEREMRLIGRFHLKYEIHEIPEPYKHRTRHHR